MCKIGHMRTPSPSKIIRAAKKRSDEEKRVNVTFRLPKGVLDRFRRLAGVEGVTATSLIEEFMKACVKSR